MGNGKGKGGGSGSGKGSGGSGQGDAKGQSIAQMAKQTAQNKQDLSKIVVMMDKLLAGSTAKTAGGGGGTGLWTCTACGDERCLPPAKNAMYVGHREHSRLASKQRRRHRQV